jgi:hypothetical protein
VSRVTGLGALIGHLSARLAAARNSQFVRSTVGVGGLTGAELALGLITAVLMARELGAAGLGTYSLALAVAALAGLPVEFGLPNLVTREIAHSGTDPDSGVAKGVMIFSVSVILVMSAVVVPLGLVYGERLTSMLVSIDRTILLFAVLLIPVNALCNIVGAAFAGKQMVVIGSVPQRLVRPGVFAVALGAVSVAEPGILTPVGRVSGGPDLCRSLFSALLPRVVALAPDPHSMADMEPCSAQARHSERHPRGTGPNRSAPDRCADQCRECRAA